MITLKSLKFAIDEQTIFENIALTLLPSSIMLTKGSNGSGKTSLLRMLAGIMPPSDGEILFGREQLPLNNLQKPYCTYIGHQLALSENVIVEDMLCYWAGLFGTKMLVGAAIQYFDLVDILNMRCAQLSQGNKKKLALARLIICPTKLWLLDEVDSNLDQSNLELLLKLIITHADNGGIAVLTSHNDLPLKTAQIIHMDQFQQGLGL